jgi:hypothetical protein
MPCQTGDLQSRAHQIRGTCYIQGYNSQFSSMVVGRHRQGAVYYEVSETFSILSESGVISPAGYGSLQDCAIIPVEGRSYGLISHGTWITPVSFTNPYTPTFYSFGDPISYDSQPYPIKFGQTLKIVRDSEICNITMTYSPDTEEVFETGCDGLEFKTGPHSMSLLPNSQTHYSFATFDSAVGNVYLTWIYMDHHMTRSIPISVDPLIVTDIFVNNVGYEDTIIGLVNGGSGSILIHHNNTIDMQVLVPELELIGSKATVSGGGSIYGMGITFGTQVIWRMDEHGNVSIYTQPTNITFRFLSSDIFSGESHLLYSEQDMDHMCSLSVFDFEDLSSLILTDTVSPTTSPTDQPPERFNRLLLLLVVPLIAISLVINRRRLIMLMVSDYLRDRRARVNIVKISSVSSLITVVPIKSLVVTSTRYEDYAADRQVLLSTHRVLFVSHKWSAIGEEVNRKLILSDLSATADYYSQIGVHHVWVDFLCVPQDHKIPIEEFIKCIPNFIKSDNVVSAIRYTPDINGYKSSAWCKLESLIIERRFKVKTIKLLPDLILTDHEEQASLMTRTPHISQSEFKMLVVTVGAEFQRIGMLPSDAKRYVRSCLDLSTDTTLQPKA